MQAALKQALAQVSLKQGPKVGLALWGLSLGSRLGWGANAGGLMQQGLWSQASGLRTEGRRKAALKLGGVKQDRALSRMAAGRQPTGGRKAGLKEAGFSAGGPQAGGLAIGRRWALADRLLAGGPQAAEGGGGADLLSSGLKGIPSENINHGVRT